MDACRRRPRLAALGRALTAATIAVVLAIPGTTTAAAELRFAAPAEASREIAPVVVDLAFAEPGAVASITVSADREAEPIATLTAPPFRFTWSAEGRSGAVTLHARARLRDGREIEAERHFEILRIDQQVEVDLVLAPVVVTDPDGRPVKGLTRDDFELRVDGKPTVIDHFQAGNAPLALAILIDTSSSMLGERDQAARAAAALLIDGMSARDRALLIGFDHRARLAAPLTSDREQLHRALDDLTTGGGTSLYDAVALAARLLAPETGRKAIVLLTDGEESMSSRSPGEVERAARRAQVVLYPVWFGGEDRHGGRRLEKLAGELGGRAVAAAGRSELLAAYAEIFAELRAQYTLGFIPRGAPDRRWHRIRVDTEVPGAHVRTRRGWYWEGSGS